MGSSNQQRIRLTVKAIAAAKPREREYTLWDSQLAHFGVRIQPSGVRSYILQTRVRGRMRKVTLGRFPELSLDAARREGASILAQWWGGGDVAPPRKSKSPQFRDFAVRYRERRKHRWKPSSLDTYDIYLRNRLLPHFGKLRLDAIDHPRVSAWFDAASVDRPGAANRAFEILRAMLGTARQWGDIGEQVPDACANIVRNPRKPVARYLDGNELARLGEVLERRRSEHPWAVAAIRLLTLTGARLSEIVHLKWDEVGDIDEDGTSARLGDSKTGPKTVWLGPEAAGLLAELPRTEEAKRVFPEDLTPDRLYTFWTGIRDEAGLPGLRIHDCRHTWASQGVMNGVGLATVGRLLGHRRRETTAIYAHLDDGALRDAAAQAAVAVARAMGFRAEPQPFPAEFD
ncbi:MAG: site-specific integrase [Gammaproteobacteria bacterium]|nr:site-specific integrase [Gammaproteobacteria bacterium]